MDAEGDPTQVCLGRRSQGDARCTRQGGEANRRSPEHANPGTERGANRAVPVRRALRLDGWDYRGDAGIRRIEGSELAGKHQNVYLSDRRRTVPVKLKILLRRLDR